MAIGELLQSVIAGFISFVSPCVLPLIPAYISYISNETLSSMKEGTVDTKKLLINSIAFVLGFSFVFIMLGATATYVGKFLSRNKKIFELIAGAIITIFGLHTAQIIRFNFLNYEKKINVKSKTPTFIRAFLMGFAFSFGWTPCVGPILGTILIMASTHSEVKEGIILLSFYSIGLGIPFVLTAIAINKFFETFKWIKRYFGQIEMFAGILIIGVGLALLFHTGIHSNYIIAIILLSVAFSMLSTGEVNLSMILGVVLLSFSIVLITNINFVESGMVNTTLISFYILLFVSIISLYRVGKHE